MLDIYVGVCKIVNMDADTKQALEAMEARIMQRFDAVDGRFKDVNASITDVYERIEKVETNLLSAFRDWSTTMELRLKGIPLIEQRLSHIENRVSEIERKNLERGL